VGTSGTIQIFIEIEELRALSGFTPGLAVYLVTIRDAID